MPPAPLCTSEPNGMRQRQDVLSSGSYISAMTGGCTSGWATRPMPVRRKFTGLMARRETIKLPAADRIYTIEEGKGITADLCDGKPCDPKAAGIKLLEPVQAPASTSSAARKN